MSSLVAAVAPQLQIRLGGQGPLPAAILERPEVRLDRTLRAFLSALAWFARGDKNQCYPSVGRLAAEVGCSPGHLRRQIKKAVALGLIGIIPAAWNRCRRVFALLWKPDKGVDARGQPYLFREPGALPARPGPAPYLRAGDRTFTCAPVAVESSSKREEETAGGGGGGPGEPPPPPAEPESQGDAARLWREQLRPRPVPPPPEAQPEAPPPVMASAPAPIAAPLTMPLPRLSDALGGPKDVARRQAEQIAALEARAAQRAAQTPPPATPPSSSQAQPKASGGLWSWLRGKGQPPGEGLTAKPEG